MALSFIVGYQSYDLSAGYNCYTATFEGIAKGLNLQDLKINGSDGYMTETISLIDAEGQDAGVTYTWACPDYTGEKDFCWYDFDNGVVADVKITDGMGLFIFTDAGDVSIVASGSVKLGQYKLEVGAGYTLTGNFSPVAVSIQDMKIEGSDGYLTETISLIDEDGQDAGVTYTWACPDYTGEKDFCWYDFDNGCVVEKMIPAGSGIFLYSDEGGVTLTLPSVL